jgi:hypothetical protein
LFSRFSRTICIFKSLTSNSAGIGGELAGRRTDGGRKEELLALVCTSRITTANTTRRIDIQANLGSEQQGKRKIENRKLIWTGRNSMEMSCTFRTPQSHLRHTKAQHTFFVQVFTKSLVRRSLIGGNVPDQFELFPQRLFHVFRHSRVSFFNNLDRLLQEGIFLHELARKIRPQDGRLGLAQELHFFEGFLLPLKFPVESNETFT